MHRLSWTWTCALTLACAAAPSSETSTSTGSDDGGTSSTSTGEGETGEPACDPLACAAQCGDDECGYPFEGVCSDDGVCTCQSTVNCLPCGNCDKYEACWSEYSIDGACILTCYYEFMYTWAGNCAITLPSDLPEDIDTMFDHFFVYIEGMQMPRGENCDDPAAPFAWWLDAEITTITLCDEMCTQFEAAGSLTTGWGIPCE